MRVEPGLEDFLVRVAPKPSTPWEGATTDEIARLEAAAQRPLPPFYQWFLARLGRRMGPVAIRTVDFSIERIVACYASGIAPSDPRYLLIGYDLDRQVTLHYFYDLERAARDDAAVVRMAMDGGEVYDEFETFREMLAWRALIEHRVYRAPQTCRGVFDDDDCDANAKLDPVMSRLGFTSPVETGRFCRVYERDGAVMACSTTPREVPEEFSFFDLAGPDTATLRSVLGAIAVETSLTVEVQAWKPPLP